MSGFGSFFRRLKEKLFGPGEMDQEVPSRHPETPVHSHIPKQRVQPPPIPPQARAPMPIPRPPVEEVSESPRAPEPQEPGQPPPRVRFPPSKPDRLTPDPYFVQIGFDFGTAFSKCVCRDIVAGNAWVHIPPGRESWELPFLMPSALRFEKGLLSRPDHESGGYFGGGLPHMKVALVKVALRQWDDPELDRFRDAGLGMGQVNDTKRLSEFVENCAIYFIAGALGSIRQDVFARFPRFGTVPDDFMPVNMAVPVADADRPAVLMVFQRVLRLAYRLADDLAGHPEIPWSRLCSLIDAVRRDVENSKALDACFIYPEVSANVQGFVMSRSSSAGLYLFSDTGAGTVDQSVFLFSRNADIEKLTYLHAEVLPWGSSNIERLAAKSNGQGDWRSIEEWRKRKEAGDRASALNRARNVMETWLEREARRSIGRAKRKLYNRRQINDLRLIFGGGGDCESPFRHAVRAQFKGDMFKPDLIRERERDGDTFDTGLPIPVDLELGPAQHRWVPRLSVAYGLSFDQSGLAPFSFPSENPRPDPEDLWRPRRDTPPAPTNDDV